MGTPIKLISREKQCVGVGKCISRPMTKEEQRKYGGVKPTKGKPVFHIPVKETKGEVEKVKGVRIIPPEREKLIETLAEVQGKTKARHHAAKIFSVSVSTIDRWIKQYGIEFDAEGKAIREPEEFAELDKQMGDLTKLLAHSATDNTETIKPAEFTIIPKGELSEEFLKYNRDKAEENARSDTITITGQETTKKYYKIGYAEYDIGENVLIKVDFRQELIRIESDKEDMTFTEIEAVIDLLNDLV